MSSKSAPNYYLLCTGGPSSSPLMSVYNKEGRTNDHLVELFSMVRKNAKEWLFKKSFEGCKIFCFRAGLQKVEFLVSLVRLALSPRLEICHDRRDWRSCNIFSSCVNFSRKQRVLFCKICVEIWNLLIYLMTLHNFFQNLSNFTFFHFTLLAKSIAIYAFFYVVWIEWGENCWSILVQFLLSTQKLTIKSILGKAKKSTTKFKITFTPN